jgi:phosphoribosyl 1,2-cyclic phosphate phosphodiesterase
MRSAGKTFLIDTSPDLRQQAMSNKIFWLDAVLYTHPHADHMHGVDELRTFNFLMGRPIPIYGNDWSLSELKEKFSYIFKYTQEGGGKPKLDLHQIKGVTNISGVQVTPLPLVHGTMPVLGFRINDMAYITDCSTIPDKTLRLMRDLDVLVLDCLRPNAHPTHLCIDEALELAHRIRARRTYFTHMGHEIEYERFAKSLPKGMYPAHDGLVIKSRRRR